MAECELVAAVAGTIPAFESKEFCVKIWYAKGNEAIETVFRDGRWSWVVRARPFGTVKCSGHCATGRDALTMAFAASSFAPKQTG